MEKYFLLLAGLVFIMEIQAQSLLDDHWNKAAFIGSVPDALEVKTGPGALRMLVTADVPKGAPQKRIYSLWQPLPPCDRNGVLLLKFEARQTASKQFYLICVAGSSPGNCPPCTHSVVYPTDIWKEFEVQMPLSGLKDKSVIEFIWEGVMQKGDRIEIRNIHLLEDDSRSAARFNILRPLNLVLDPANPVQKFSGTIFPLRSQIGGSYVMKAAEGYFLRAEGILRGWNMGGGTAQQWYEDGIRTSIKNEAAYKGIEVLAGVTSVSDEEINAYINGTTLQEDFVDPVDSQNSIKAQNDVCVKWDESASNEQKLQRIIIQKWIANFPISCEGPNRVNLSNGTIDTDEQIRRLIYSDNEINTNNAELQKGIELLNQENSSSKFTGDIGGTRVWWDKANVGNF